MRFITPILIGIIAIGSVRAAVTSTTGKEYKLWTEGRYVVLIATFHDHRTVSDPELAPNRATLKSIAVLAGTLDPGANPTGLKVGFHHGHPGSIKEVPSEGAMVMAVIWLLPEEIAKERGYEAAIVSSFCHFMPNRSSTLVTIDGLGDKRVLETIEKLRKARANPDADPHGMPATRPTTRPAP